jgi:DNA-binding MarR family transcriptional regulator
MSRVLTALDGHGHIDRAVDPRDARGVLISITDAGRGRLDEIRSHRTALLARRLHRLDTPHRAAISAALPALEALLEAD